MTDVQRSADCGNSPKNGLAEDIAIALETRGGEFTSATFKKVRRIESFGG